MDPLLLAKIAAVMLVLDGLWIYIVAGPAFFSMIPDIQGSAMRIRPGGAVVAYAAMVLLFNQFITADSTGWDAFVLGLLTYAIFDATNYAVFDNYDLKTAIVDTAWGGVLFWLTYNIIYKTAFAY